MYDKIRSVYSKRVHSTVLQGPALTKPTVLTIRSALHAPLPSRGPVPSARACAPPTAGRALVHAHAHTHNTHYATLAVTRRRSRLYALPVQCVTANNWVVN